MTNPEQQLQECACPDDYRCGCFAAGMAARQLLSDPGWIGCAHGVGLAVECPECPEYGRQLEGGRLVRCRIPEHGLPAQEGRPLVTCDQCEDTGKRKVSVTGGPTLLVVCNCQKINVGMVIREANDGLQAQDLKGSAHADSSVASDQGNVANLDDRAGDRPVGRRPVEGLEAQEGTP